MDNHPIPQDITGFQFKLIGNMTIKQFAYLSTGSVVGWIIFSLPITSLIKLPASSAFILLGIGFAFFSFQGRPMDIMILNFIKSLFGPTQFVYQKSDTPHRGKVAQQPNAFEPPTSEEEAEEETRVEELKLEEQKIISQLKKAKEEEIKDEGSKLRDAVPQKVIELEKQLSETVFQKQQLEEELLNLRRQFEEQKKEVFKVAPQESQNVRSVPPDLGKTVGLPIAPEYPNIISGIIKDPRGNPLQNILVEVKDQEGNPVRAFKTNPLGQFTASTPLTNGIYRIEFEDPQNKNKFELIEFEAKGNVILPLEVVSIDTREELRKELFS